MKKSLATLIILSTLVLAGCAVGVSPVQPPHAGYYGHPSVVVIPGTYVYAMTEVADDIYFHVGWWWRLWDDRWYKSRYYDRGWSHYRGVPVFYREIDPRWRDFYRHRRWHGHSWDCERIPATRVQHDWKRWQDNRYWEKERNWGVRGFRPGPYRQAGLKETERDGSRYRHDHPLPGHRYEDRQRGSGPTPLHRQEFSRERGGPRPAQEFFTNRAANDRGSEIRDRERNRERTDRRQAPPSFERRRGGAEADGIRRDRESRDRQEYGRPPFDQAGQEPDGNSRQGRERYREQQDRPPQYGQRQHEARPERPQRREESASRGSQFEPRQRGGSQDTPQKQERPREEGQRRRPPQGYPWQEAGQPGSMQTR